MSLRLKLYVYLLAIHLPFAAAAVYVLEKNRLLLLVVEGVFAISLLIGIWLVRSMFAPLELVRTGTQFLEDKEFGLRFREAGHPEVDGLVRIYNRMVEGLREERIKQQEQHHFLDKLMNASPAGILILDFEERITSVNPAAERLLRLPAHALIGRRIDEIDVPFSKDLAAIRSGESTVIPLGANRRTKCQRSEFLDRGFPRPFFVLEELTEELRRSEKDAYEKLIRMMSHEVNNSLGAASSLLHSCLNYKDQIGDADREDFTNALGVAIERSDRLGVFMKDLADVVRIPSPILQPCDVRGLLARVEDVFAAELRTRAIAWEWRVNEALEPIPMDRIHMEQAFVNIVKNAIEAIGTNGTIAVHLGSVAGRPRLVIEDTGAGISPEVRSRLFTPFFTTKQNGQGMGLTVVREILGGHGFECSLEGGPGEPTRFTVYF